MNAPDQHAVPPPPPVADIWGAALADGSGRHVPVRRHWPELAAALDAEVDAAGMVPDTGQARAREGLPFVPDEMWLTADWGVIESDGDGAWRTIENGSYVEHLPAVRIRLVPDIGQAREQILRDITFGEYVIAVCDAIGLPHDSPRAAVVEAIRAAVAAAQAPESPTDSTPKAGRVGSGEAETATGTGRALDVPRNEQELIAWQHQEADRLRALLGTATTPDRLAWISKAGETAAAERQARYQETACARRPAATTGDPAQPDLAYARSEVNKWLASTDPYCILPTRIEHIPALLARLDELEGTS